MAAPLPPNYDPIPFDLHLQQWRALVFRPAFAFTQQLDDKRIYRGIWNDADLEYVPLQGVSYSMNPETDAILAVSDSRLAEKVAHSWRATFFPTVAFPHDCYVTDIHASAVSGDCVMQEMPVCVFAKPTGGLHVCSMLCPMWKPDSPLFNPEFHRPTRAVRCETSMYMCVRSGLYHWCAEGECVRGRVLDGTETMCDISGISFADVVDGGLEDFMSHASVAMKRVLPRVLPRENGDGYVDVPMPAGFKRTHSAASATDGGGKPSPQTKKEDDEPPAKRKKASPTVSPAVTARTTPLVSVRHFTSTPPLQLAHAQFDAAVVKMTAELHESSVCYIDPRAILYSDLLLFSCARLVYRLLFSEGRIFVERANTTRANNSIHELIESSLRKTRKHNSTDVVVMTDLIWMVESKHIQTRAYPSGVVSRMTQAVRQRMCLKFALEALETLHNLVVYTTVGQEKVSSYRDIDYYMVAYLYTSAQAGVAPRGCEIVPFSPWLQLLIPAESDVSHERLLSRLRMPSVTQLRGIIDSSIRVAVHNDSSAAWKLQQTPIAEEVLADTTISTAHMVARVRLEYLNRHGSVGLPGDLRDKLEAALRVTPADEASITDALNRRRREEDDRVKKETKLLRRKSNGRRGVVYRGGDLYFDVDAETASMQDTFCTANCHIPGDVGIEEVNPSNLLAHSGRMNLLVST